MARIALIAPPSESLTQAPPVNLGYLASSLAAAGHEARIFDFKALDADAEAVIQQIINFGPDVAGISCITVEMPGTKYVVGRIRGLLKNVPVVLGGVHPTVMHSETLEETGADYVVRGEGEKTFVNLVNAIESGRKSAAGGVRGISYIKEGKAESNPEESYIEDLDALPFPAWHLIPPVKYSTFTMQLYKRREVVCPILTSRGCPYGCTFCASRVHGRKIRLRSPENVLDEMELLMRDYSVEEFLILDDNFTQNKKHALAVCEGMIERTPGIVWRMPQGMRVDTVDEELIDTFRRAGCYEVGFGIESGNQAVLDSLEKRLDLSLVGDRIRLIKKHGINVYGFFILGLPGDTKKTVMDTIRFMHKGFDHVSVSYCIPYPGSEVFEEFARERGGKHDWSLFAHHHIFSGISELSPKQLRFYMRLAIFWFYSHPRRALLLIGKLKSIPLKYTVRLILKYVIGKK